MSEYPPPSPEEQPEGHRLDFMQDFGSDSPELSDDEIEAAARRFDSLVSSKLETWPRDADSSSTRTVVPTNLVKSDVVVGDGIWSITVERRRDHGSPRLHPEIPDASISLVFFDGNGQEHEKFNYGLSEGVVRRDDLGDSNEILFDMYPDEDLGDFARRVVENGVVDLDAAANEDLEEDSGFNRQPVGNAEISGLTDFLDLALD